MQISKGHSKTQEIQPIENPQVSTNSATSSASDLEQLTNQITIEQFRNVIDYALRLKNTEEMREARERATSRLEQDLQSEINERGIQIAAVYRVAQDLGLDARYIQQALELNYPSPAQKLSDIQAIRADPSMVETTRALDRSVEEYISEIKNRLQNLTNIRITKKKWGVFFYNPKEDLPIEYIITVYEVNEEKVKNSWLRKILTRKKERVKKRHSKLAKWKIRPSSCNVSIEYMCSNAKITRACLDLINNPPKMWGYVPLGKVYSVYNYNPNQ